MVKIKRIAERILIMLILVTLIVSISLNVSAEVEPGTYYQIFVRSFYDSTGDGVGDLQGVIKQLDYLEELGIGGIWLMPIMKSNSYHGYDIKDYRQVNDDYGSLADFRELTKEAKQRDIEVIVDLIVTHTSDYHPWFEEAMLDEDSQYRDYYIWADDKTDTDQTNPYTGAPLWQPSLNGMYSAFFSRSMPDVNFESQNLRDEMIDIAHFWLKQGADGFRIDAVKHAYPPEEHQKNYDWWSEFYQRVKAEYSKAYIVGEVWDDYDVIAPYYDYFDSNFNFNVGESIINAIQTGQADKLSDDLAEIYQYYQENIGDYIDAPFLTNHDQDRVMSQLNEDYSQAKLAASIYLTLPGNPFIYYGEEIGMRGQKPDPRIREPFLWSEDGKEGETSWDYPLENRGVTSLETEKEQDDSLFKLYNRLIELRDQNQVLYTGEIEFFSSKPELLSYRRIEEGTKLEIYHNLSQTEVEIELAGQDVIFTTEAETEFDTTVESFKLAPQKSLILSN